MHNVSPVQPADAAAANDQVQVEAVIPVTDQATGTDEISIERMPSPGERVVEMMVLGLL